MKAKYFKIIFIMALLLEIYHMVSISIPMVESIYAFKTISQNLENLPLNKAANKLDIVNQRRHDRINAEITD